MSSGPSTSIFETIKAQKKTDECIWIETNNIAMPQWNNAAFFFRLRELKGVPNLNFLPSLSIKPDIVIFEEIYHSRYPIFAKQLSRCNIPYIIVPRCSLCIQAQHNHAFLKKKIANLLFFNQFIKGASSIHYLTEDEQRDSGPKWNNHSYVLPNGINMPDTKKIEFSKTGIKACYIGRIDIYQKGLDLLLEAMSIIQEELREAQFSLKIFGPINHDAKKVALLIKKYNISDLVSLKGEVSGTEKESAFLNSDLFVLTSRFEGHSIALLEALSYGLPVAISPGTNMKQKVQQYNAGWCCEETNSDNFCDMLLSVINERDGIALKGNNAFELAKTYNYDKISNQFHNIALKIIESSSRASK